ncbi:MAG: C1 family peptidase [Deltaproteobacteria bacterium]|nr:C1 family peptidase [Deltaproteobacteria bacterium]
MYKKILLLLMVVIPFSFFLQGSSSAERTDILRFGAEDTLEQIRAKIKQNGYKFTVDHNWVFDMSPEQKKKFLSRRPPSFPRSVETVEDMGPLAEHIGQSALPSSFDWRDYNGRSYIGPVRNQGDCGDCYAFGACAAAEGTYNWANGKYDANCADFSEAFVAFCLSDHYSGFDGCDGADYDYEELDALVDYGVCNENVYPYEDYEQPCQSSAWAAPRTTFHSWHRIKCNDIEAIKTAIMTYGVVDAAVYVGSAFEAYMGGEGPYEDTNTSCEGYYPDDPCFYAITNHGVALVGWDDNNGEGYWILRNSWGTNWGEGGYMRIKYTSANVACAVAYLTIGGGPSPTLQYSWNMDTNPGWTTQGLWAWGTPTGGGGEEGGNPDPTSGYTGNNVYGYNLAGDYENSLAERHLTSTAINCSGLSNVSLKFRRWLGVENYLYDHAYVRVSNNGTTWTTFWRNTAEVADSSWVLQDFDISSVADGQSTVYLRWTMGITDGSLRYCGWNIDDVEIWGVESACPDCPSDGVITNATYRAGTTCACSNASSITLGANVTVENGAAVTFTAPTITVQPGFRAESGAVVKMQQ